MIKPVADVSSAAILIVFMSPVLLVAMISLAVSNHGKIWFIQTRPGKDCRPFRIVKFRTMNDRVNEKGELLQDSARLTGVGKWIRKLSIDELPQLINVLKGEMSIVGPRPLLSEYVSLYDETQIRRHEVLPGITGWAQVNGRNAVEWQKRFEYDVWYVDHMSLSLDLKILFLTVIRVIQLDGISGKNSVTMEKFGGNS